MLAQLCEDNDDRAAWLSAFPCRRRHLPSGARAGCTAGTAMAAVVVAALSLRSDVDRLIASCDLGTVHGIRDRAILLLFARLGLRAGDVRKMQLDDIDWAAGT